MSAQETVAKILEDGLPLLTGAAKSTKADKYDWKPEETSRSAKEVFIEAVAMFSNTAGMLEQRAMPAGYEEMVEKFGKMSAEELSTQAEKDIKVLVEAIKAFPASDLEQTMDLPWGTMSFFDIMCYPYWNMMWHAGQINYIQTLYGDQEMH